MADAKKIFIADDDRFFRELYQMVLGEEGYDVTFAITGKEAVEKCAAANPDLVILDVLMPELNGYEVCSKLREMPELAMTPILMLTGLSADEDKIKGYHVGADDFLTKPFSPKVFRERVKNILERSIARKVAAPAPATAAAPAAPLPSEAPAPAAQPSEAIRAMEPGANVFHELFGGPVPHGVNVLMIGPLGSGKSFFSRSFLAEGLKENEKCMFICLDESPGRIRQALGVKHGLDAPASEIRGGLRFIDAFSWSGGRVPADEPFCVKGALDLSELSALINEAAEELEQTEAAKQGGRRVLDSLSSLFLKFDLPYIQRFIAYLARSGQFAEVTTFFVLEQGTCDEQSLNNIKYLMDAVVEFKHDKQRYLAKIQSLKWAPAGPDWLDLTQPAG
ncbi:MAG TPA: response regulator [Verrucomicrobiae bacterium]|jgi:CheY-like chemotaxis protein|nr:response regulator [Verrucomicrobiae bacterium]